MVRRMGGGGWACDRVHEVIVRRQLSHSQCLALCTTGLAEIIVLQSHALPRTYRNASAQVGESKGGCAIAAVGGAEQRKQRCVLRDRQELSVAQRPSCGCEVVGYQQQ